MSALVLVAGRAGRLGVGLSETAAGFAKMWGTALPGDAPAAA